MLGKSCTIISCNGVMGGQETSGRMIGSQCHVWGPDTGSNNGVSMLPTTEAVCVQLPAICLEGILSFHEGLFLFAYGSLEDVLLPWLDYF